MYDDVGVDGKPYKKDQWREVATHDDLVIHGFFGPYRVLSNMWPCAIIFRGNTFPSVENAYQSAKFGDEHVFQFTQISPKESKKLSITMAMKYSSEQWNAMRISVMRECLQSKFANPELTALLLATGEKHLAETNWWGDQFWGCNKDAIGENNLGRLLMEIRTGLK